MNFDAGDWVAIAIGLFSAATVILGQLVKARVSTKDEEAKLKASRESEFQDDLWERYKDLSEYVVNLEEQLKTGRKQLQQTEEQTDIMRREEKQHAEREAQYALDRAAWQAKEVRLTQRIKDLEDNVAGLNEYLTDYVRQARKAGVNVGEIGDPPNGV